MLPLSFLYSIIIFIRNLFYDIRVFGVNRVNVPVISIGNITAGGTGKTPVIEYLVNYFKRKNIKVAVISRGYKRNTKGTLVVSDGSSIIAKPEQAGDEPYQIAVRFQEAVVIVDENRFRGAKLAVEKYKPEVILLDDSFQHRRIHRDLDIVLIDVTKPPHKEYMLPAGLRREPLSSLKRTNVLLFTRWEDEIKFDVSKYKVPVTGKICFVPSRLVKFDNSEIINADELMNKSCTAFCGIGNPDSFGIILKGLGFKVTSIRIFPDHHYYSTKDLELIKKDFSSKAEIIVTTEKDYIRLTKYKDELTGLPLYYLEISTRFIEGEGMLDEKLKSLGINS